ncbi:MAG: peptidoglycan bridge formation glycyltransferase FemA/FemB family protein [Candidatus Falkowbacteria bacterium]
MQIIHLETKEQLDQFVGAQQHSQFLQSWEWGEFQQKVSGTVWRVAVEDEGNLIASAKLIKKTLPMGKSYFYCGRGPVFAQNVWHEEAAKLLFAEIERLAKEEMIMFLRFDPTLDCIEQLRDLVGEKPLDQTIDVQPSQTIVLPLSLSEEELLKQMHTKTRYNIKLSQKKSLKIVEAGNDRFEELWSLLDQTSGRDKFNPHGRSYYQAMLELDPTFIKMHFAEYKGKAIAASILGFFGDTTTYLHGGSANDDRNLMAPYALQWHGIMQAKDQGYAYYDLYGIDEERWPGVTRFKKGFGGEEIKYPGSFDLIFDSGWYSIYKMVRKVRRSF